MIPWVWHTGNITCWFVLLEDRFNHYKTRSNRIVLVLCGEKRSPKSTSGIFLLNGNRNIIDFKTLHFP